MHPIYPTLGCWIFLFFLLLRNRGNELLQKSQNFQISNSRGKGICIVLLGCFELFEDLRKELSIIIDGAYSD